MDTNYKKVLAQPLVAALIDHVHHGLMRSLTRAIVMTYDLSPCGGLVIAFLEVEWQYCWRGPGLTVASIGSGHTNFAKAVLAN